MLRITYGTPNISKKRITNKAQSVAFSYLIDKNGETIL